MSGKNLKVNLIANTSQFKSAMAQTSSQIKLLNSEFKNAAAETDKYGNKLDATGAKKKQLNGVIEQYRLRVKAIKDEQKHWTQQLKEGNITEAEHAEKQKELARRLNNTEAEMKRYEGQLKRLNVEGKKTTMTYAEFDKKFRDVGRTMRNVGAQVGITAGVGFMAMKRVLGDVVEEAASFEAQMSEVKAISGATGDEIAKLTNQSKELGRATKFTAQEAAEAQANLARAGFKVNEIYDAMPGLLDLAASSNLDLGTSANITSNIIRTFNKDAKEASKIADVLAKGAATANTDVQGLGESMKTAGPVAQSLGIQFESVAAATGIMADAGIEGSQSGRMLRQGMLRLSKPTGEAAKLIKKMGIEVFDADGNMKSLDKVVAELSNGMKGYTGKQKAAALATIFGSESTAGWTVLLDKGSKALKDYTVELENSEGAAKDMADVMQDNAQGAIIRMQSALSSLKIELGEKLLPTLGKGADMIGDFAGKMAEMDEKTVNTIAQMALLVTAVLGVTTVVAGGVAAIGAFMAFAGPVGVALTVGAGLVTALGVSMATSGKKTQEYNGELGKQAESLETLVDRYDKLRDKSNLTTEELGRLKDLQQQLNKETHHEKVAKLQAEYDALAKKSGLSKDELKNLLATNDEIIKQSPSVETAISNEGNAIVDNTDKVREYIAELHKLNITELEIKRKEALAAEKGLLDEIAKREKEINETNELRMFTIDAQQAGTAKHGEMLNDINDKLKEAKKNGEDTNLLEQQKEALLQVIDGNYQEHLNKLEKKRDKAQGIVDKNKEELEKNKEINGVLADAILKEAGIKETGQEGLVVLEEKLVKNRETLSELDAQLEKNGKLTAEEQEQYEKITAKNKEYEKAQQKLNEELGLYGSINSLVESKRHLLSDSTNEQIKSLEKTHEIKVAEGNIIEQLQKKQAEYVKEREQLEQNREKQGANKAEIDKQIAALDEKIGKGDAVQAKILEELGLLELVKDGIQLNSKELESYLVGLGYTTEQAADLAKVLVDETLGGLNSGEAESKEAGKKKGEKHAEGIESTKNKNEKSGKSVVDSTISELTKGNADAEQGGKNKGDAHNKGLGSTKNSNVQTGKSVTDDIIRQLKSGESEAQAGGKGKGDAHNKGLSGTSGANRTAASNLITNVSNVLGRSNDGGGGRKAGSLFTEGLRGQQGSARSAGQTTASSGERGLRSVKTNSAGSMFVAGFRSSINSGQGSIWSTAWNLGKTALGALNSSIRTASPSRETAKSGTWFTQGFQIAIEEEGKKAINSASVLGKETLDALNEELDEHKLNFGALAMSLEKDKQVLKVEHSFDSKMDDFINAINVEKTNNDNFIKRLLTATLEQNQILMQLLQKDQNIYVDGDILGSITDKKMTNNFDIEAFMRGERG